MTANVKELIKDKIQPLTRREEADLARCEKAIASAQKSFVRKGEALHSIHTGELYRIDHPSFEQYALKEWDIASRTAYRFMATATVMVSLSSILRQAGWDVDKELVPEHMAMQQLANHDWDRVLGEFDNLGLPNATNWSQSDDEKGEKAIDPEADRFLCSPHFTGKNVVAIDVNRIYEDPAQAQFVYQWLVGLEDFPLPLNESQCRPLTEQSQKEPMAPLGSWLLVVATARSQKHQLTADYIYRVLGAYKREEVKKSLKIVRKQGDEPRLSKEFRDQYQVFSNMLADEAERGDKGGLMELASALEGLVHTIRQLN